jgi:DNA-binding NarL/FixJ family response regulator
MNILTNEYERSLLELMATGHTDSAIAKRLNVGKRTLERQLAGLMARVGAPSRLALGAIAAQHRWIDIENLLHQGAGGHAHASVPDTVD